MIKQNGNTYHLNQSWKNFQTKNVYRNIRKISIYYSFKCVNKVSFGVHD